MTTTLNEVIIRRCWLVLAVGIDDDGDHAMLDEADFDNYPAAIAHAAKLADQHGVNIDGQTAPTTVLS